MPIVEKKETEKPDRQPSAATDAPPSRGTLTGIMQRILAPVVSAFLSARLRLKVNQSKTQICDSDTGIEFIGAYLKPHRRYISRQSLRRITKKLPRVLARRNPNQINSYLGILTHYRAYHLTKSLFYPIHGKGGYFTKWMKKWVEYPR